VQRLYIFSPNPWSRDSLDRALETYKNDSKPTLHGDISRDNPLKQHDRSRLWPVYARSHFRPYRPPELSPGAVRRRAHRRGPTPLRALISLRCVSLSVGIDLHSVGTASPGRFVEAAARLQFRRGPN